MDAAKSTRCTNVGHYIHPRYTSPCCYAEMEGAGEGVHACPECGRRVRCYEDTVPEFVAELVDDDDDTEEGA